MNSQDFIAFAAKVAGMQAAGARTAVSRAYYGAYHQAVSFLESLECAPVRNSNSHALVPRYLCCSDDDAHKAAKMAGRLLGDLHGDRIKADYRLEDGRAETLLFAQLSVETAKDIEQSLSAFMRACSDPAVLSTFRAALERVIQIRDN